VSASDISEEALEVARINAIRHLAPNGLTLAFEKADLLAGIPGPFDLIVANPPYVPSSEAAALLERGWKEPMLALDGGPDGLDLVARLIRQASQVLVPGGFLLIEADAMQSKLICAMFLKEGFCDVGTWKDLAGRERVEGARKP
jgi:release factor glutamine methyltransferase